MQKQLLNGYWVSKPQTHLKYAVEVQIARDPLRLLGLVEPIIERMVYEDLPLNLGAIKARVEDNKQRAKLEELEQQGMSCCAVMEWNVQPSLIAASHHRLCLHFLMPAVAWHHALCCALHLHQQSCRRSSMVNDDWCVLSLSAHRSGSSCCAVLC